jgi:hypothetical protein
MTHERGGDDSGFDDLVLDLLNAMRVADEMLEEHPRAAVRHSQTEVLRFLIQAGCHRRDLGLAPAASHLPGDAVARLVMAFENLEQGLVDPVLAPSEELETNHGRHALLLKDRADRVRPALVMELLMMAGYGTKKAAQEVARLLKGDPILTDVGGDHAAAITRWRHVIKRGSADAWDTEMFNVLLATAKLTVQDHGGTAVDFIKLAPGLLGRSQTEPTE